MKKSILFVAIALAVLATSYALLQNRPKPLGNLSMQTLQGQTLNLADLKGKVVLVNFWATSCSGCITEMPKLKALQQQKSFQAYQTLAVAMSYDERPYIDNFIKKNELPFTIIHDLDGKIAQQFGGINLTPTSYLLDKKGNIVQKYIGEPDMKKLSALIDKLTAESV